jgi:hypothetical protein
MSDIATRLRQTRANMIGTEDEQHYWDCHDAAAEIERLRLTDEEREAISAAACICEDAGRTDIAVIINTALERLA